jgi:hypothetical protein
MLVFCFLVACQPQKAGGPRPDRDDPEVDEELDDDDDDDDDDGPDPEQDTDGDGLTDGEEEELGTDPEETDTDGDGWDDQAEVEGNTDPTRQVDHPYTGGWAIGACRDDIASTGNDVGDIAEDFTLTDQFGDRLDLHDFCDREVLLVSAAFW